MDPSFGDGFNPFLKKLFFLCFCWTSLWEKEKLLIKGEFSKGVENTVGKGEIACNEQFLIYPQCFQKTCSANTLKTLTLQVNSAIFMKFNIYAVFQFSIV